KYVTESPEATLAYVYAILFSPTYRSRYADLLKTEFPRVPLATRPELFSAVAAIGFDLIACHLLDESFPLASWNGRKAVVCPFETLEPVLGGNGPMLVERKSVKHLDGKMFFAAKRWFERVPEAVWKFRAGGYRICEKWLISRDGQAITAQEALTYRRMVL